MKKIVFFLTAFIFSFNYFCWNTSAAQNKISEKESQIRAENLELTGHIEDKNIRFELIFDFKTDKKSSVKILEGEVSKIESEIKDISSSLWGSSDAEIIADKKSYIFKTEGEGKYRVKILFSSGIKKSGNFKMTGFSLISALSRKFKIHCDTTEIELNISNGLNIEKKDHKKNNSSTVSGILPSSGAFKLSWEKHIQLKDRELVSTVKANLINNVHAGSIKFHGEYDYKIIQGKLSELSFKISKNLDIVRVSGQNIQDWKIKDGKLHIKLSRKYDKTYNIRITGEKILPEFPCGFAMPKITPLKNMQYSGKIIFGTNKAIKLLVNKTEGLDQVANSINRRTKAIRKNSFEKMYTYNFSGEEFSLNAHADNISPSYSVDLKYFLKFSDENLRVRTNCSLDIKDAALEKLIVEIDKSLTVIKVEGHDILSDRYDIFEKEGKKYLKILFRENVIGKSTFNIFLEKRLNEEKSVSIPDFRIQNSKTLRGYIFLSAVKGISLKTDKIKFLKPVHTGALEIREPGLQIAYRIKNKEWKADIELKYEKTAINSKVFHLATIGEGSIYCSSIFAYHISGSPTDKIVYKINSNAKNIEFTGAKIADWKKLKSLKNADLWQLSFSEKTLGDSEILLSYELPVKSSENNYTLAASSSINAKNESGYLLLSSSRNLKIKTLEKNQFVQEIDNAEIPETYRAALVNPLLKSYRMLKNNQAVKVSMKSYSSEALLDTLVERMHINTNIDENGQSVSAVEMRIKNSGSQFLNVLLPENAELWNVTVDNKRRRLSLDNGRLLIPIPRHRNENPISVHIEYAQKFGNLGNNTELTLTAPKLNNEIMQNKWNIEIPENYDASLVKSSMNSTVQSRVRGIPGIIQKFFSWFSSALSSLLFIPWIIITFAGILAAACWGSKKFKITGTVVSVIIAFIGLLSTLLCLQGLANFAENLRTVKPFTTNKIEFVRAANVPGKASEIILNLINMKELNLGQIVYAGIIIVLSAVCIAGVFKYRNHILKILLLAAAATLILEAGGQWFYFSILSAFILVFCIPPLISVLLWVVFFKKCRIKHISTIILVSIITFFSANSLSAENSDHKDILINNLEYDVRVEENGITVKAEFHIKSKEEGEILLIESPGVIKDKKFDDDSLSLLYRDNSYYLKSNDEGDFSVNVNFIVPFQQKGAAYSFTVPIPVAAKNLVNVHSNIENMSVKSPNCVFFKKQTEDGAEINSAKFAPGDNAFFVLTPLGRQVKDESESFIADIKSLVKFKSGFVKINCIADFEIVQGESNAFEFSIPENMRIVDVKCRDLGAWNYRKKDNILNVFLNSEKHGRFQINITAQITGKTLPYKAEIAPVKVKDAKRQYGSMGIFSDSKVKTRIESFKGFSKINSSDFIIRKDRRNAEIEEAFKYNKVPASILVSTASVKSEIKISENTKLDYEDERTVISSDLELEISKLGLFMIKVLIPGKFEVDRVKGTAIHHWDEIEEDGKSKLILNFKQRLLGKSKIYIELSKLTKLESGIVNIPRIHVENAKRQNGTLTIRTDRGTRMEIIKKEGLEKKSILGHRGGKDSINRFTIFRPDWTLKVSMAVSKPWIRSEILEIVDISEEGLSSESLINYKIENAGIKKFNVIIPSNSGTPEFKGKNISAIYQNDKKTWTIELYEKVYGQYKLRCKYRQKNDFSKNLELLPIISGDSQMQKGFSAVMSGDTLQIKEVQSSGDVNRCSPEKIPASLKNRNLSNAVMCFRTVNKNFKITLDVKKHKTAKTLPASIKSVNIKSIVTSEGRMVSELSMKVVNRNANFLKMRLPQGNSIWGIRVDNIPANTAVEGDITLIPLKQNIREAQKIKMVYSVSVPSDWEKNQQKYIGPAFELPANNIKWSLYLPEDRKYSDFKGSMTYINKMFRRLMPLSLYQYDQSTRRKASKNIESARNIFNTGNKLAKSGSSVQAESAYQQALNLAQNDQSLKNDIEGQWLRSRRRNYRETINELHGNKKYDTAESMNQSKEIKNYKQQRATNKISDKFALQQQAAGTVQQPLSFIIPERGTALYFERKHQFKKYAPLKLKFEADDKLKWKKIPDMLAYSLAFILSVIFFTIVSFAFFRKEKSI